MKAGQCWRRSGTGGHCSENPQAIRTAKGSLGASAYGTFQSRKGFESGWERALKRNFTNLTTFPPWLSWRRKLLKVFPPSVSREFYKVRFIEWDLWSNIFKFLSNVWFFTSIPHGGLTSDNILEEDGSKTKQNMHCRLCALDVRHQISRNKATNSALLPLTCFSQWRRHWSQFPLHSFPVYSQESPEWHTQLPDFTDRGSWLVRAWQGLQNV